MIGQIEVGHYSSVDHYNGLKNFESNEEKYFLITQKMKITIISLETITAK